MGAGFPRACLEKSSRDAVRPQEKNCEESRWVAGIGEVGVEVMEDVLEEPDNAGVGDADMVGEDASTKIGEPTLAERERSYGARDQPFALPLMVPALCQGTRERNGAHEASQGRLWCARVPC